MSSKELIDSLRKTADETVLLLRQEAEHEAAAAKAEAARRLAQLRDDAGKNEAAARTEAVARAVSAANIRARSLILAAEQELCNRLKEAASLSLAALRNAGYENAFRSLARELPSLQWKTVRVNPMDKKLAKQCFSGAEIVPDAAITGGMDAATEDGSIRVVNTFEKRLERSWEDMLPTLIKDVYREVSDGVSASS